MSDVNSTFQFTRNAPHSVRLIHEHFDDRDFGLRHSQTDSRMAGVGSPEVVDLHSYTVHRSKIFVSITRGMIPRSLKQYRKFHNLRGLRVDTSPLEAVCDVGREDHLLQGPIYSQSSAPSL